MKQSDNSILRIKLDGPWELRGWRQNDWALAITPFGEKVRHPEVGPLPASVPGSVRGALLREGLVPDPMTGRQSVLSEWTEHRHWTFSTELPEVAAEVLAEPGRRATLVCEGLDHAGAVVIDSEVVSKFCGSFVTHRFDLTDAIRAGGRRLSIVFTEVPDGLGQNGWTSKIRSWKPRFYYGWDWTPRIVQTGITGPVVLKVGARVDLDRAEISTDFSAAKGRGTVSVELACCGLSDGHRVVVTVTDTDGRTVATATGLGPLIQLELEPLLWQVRPAGSQPLYEVTIELTSFGRVIDVVSRRVGFRELAWRPTAAAPAGADSWLCSVNGRTVFLAGVNWVPLRPDFADVPDEAYRERLTTYRDMGVTMLRVWGGAGAERDVFYDLCDELGILVWQELPLSSSGLDNEPPKDRGYSQELTEVATAYADRLRHHPCLAMWGGGNELTIVDTPGAPGTPLSADHPPLAAARDALNSADPGRRFVATSPSGPRFSADPAEFGRGLHHDVHGPWEWAGSHQSWRDYWAADDAVMRSEVGVAGASPLDLLAACGLTESTDRTGLRRLWAHSSAWWLDEFDRADPESSLAEWVELSSRRQAEWLAEAAASALGRHPSCAGFLVWLGHDSFPCAVSLALLDWWGRPKPAAGAFQEIFATHPACTSDRPALV